MNPQSPLHGVHHTARPTWKLAETVRFYRDVLGLPLVHAITARGWGPADHADFVHFFFDSGHGSHIAFFFYIGTEEPEFLKPREDYRYRATHTAWSVPSRQALLDLRRRLEDAGVPMRFQIRHELVESIYFLDPNGYAIEVSWQARPLTEMDIDDARRTMDAAIALYEKPGALRSIDDVWRMKGQMVEQELAALR